MLDLRFLRYWHSRYNKLVFDGKLSKPAIVLAEYQPDWVGACEVDKTTSIYIAPYLTREEARRVLLHEMIHQWQHEHKLPMNHGMSFKQWETPCHLLSGLQPWP